MSKPPQPPQGNADKTVIIRPNPGGRRDAAPASTPKAPGADVWGNEEPQAPARAPRVAPTQQPPSYQPPPYQPSSGYQPQAFPPAQAYQPPPPSAPRPSQPGPPLELGIERHPLVAGPNPILNAVRPLLILLANLRLTADHSAVAPMMDAIAENIASVDRDLAQAGTSAEHLRMTKYAICATADDIVQNIPGSDRLLWTQYSMMSRFFGTAVSGIGFFDELQRAKAQPTLNYDVLELMHACLSLGFQGQYRSGAGGDVMLQQIRRDVYQTLRTFRPAPGDDISPHWKGQDIKPKYMQVRLPVWVTAASAALVLFGIFIGFRILLGLSSDALADKLTSVHPLTEVRLARDTPKPPPPPPPGESQQLIRVRTALQDEIKARKLEVFESRGQVVVKLLTDTLFEPGSADVDPSFAVVLDKVASVLDKEPKTISIVGHTDNVKLKSRLRFKNNQDLSVKRAQAVAAIMGPKLTDKARIETSGMGETKPIADNKTKEGRAANRRVEIFLPRTGP